MKKHIESKNTFPFPVEVQPKLDGPMDYLSLMNTIQFLSDKYPFMGVTYIGTSVLGRGIPMVVLGKGDKDTKSVMYVGSQRGTEWISTTVLLRFICDYCEAYENSATVSGINMSTLFESRNVCIIPCLNVDGADIVSSGVENCILKDRLTSLNGGEDFHSWIFNARGVDLKGCYSSDDTKTTGFEEDVDFFAPSEPECASLCNLLRFSDEISALLTVSAESESLRYVEEDDRSLSVAKLISGMTHLDVSKASSCGNLIDWYSTKLHKTALDADLGSAADLTLAYSKLKDALFTLPILN